MLEDILISWAIIASIPMLYIGYRYYQFNKENK